MITKSKTNNMKKTLLLTLALGLASASSLMADVDLYITGSTAFRANVYNACTKLFTTPPNPGTTLFYGDAAHGGDANNNSSTASWVMTGTPITALTNIQGGKLTIHGLFTGSIQGIETVEDQTPLTFATITAGALSYSTNTPTIGFSDASGVSSPYPATGDYSEENVCVQPFVMVRSVGGGSAVTNINNITWEQMEYGIPKGRLPLSSWTGIPTDTNFVYIIERTADSGTRRCFTAGEYYQFSDPVTIYIFDVTNTFFFKGTNENSSLVGISPNGVVGPAGLGNANLNWGPGYVGGGDIKNEINYNNSNNLAIANLSIADAKSAGPSNWTQVVSFNGLWPTAAGPGIHGNTGTNDYTPITAGFYPLWGNEVLVYPNIDPTSLPGEIGQNLTAAQLGSQTQPGSILGVFDHQTLFSGGSPIAGSIENEIELSKSGSPGATAIRLSDMKSSRQFVGGTITP
jgi:hypothetical protein